jgi:diguanylate cyclase (GGDEF)-like protein
VRSLSRIFATLLLVLFISVALSLFGSWRLRHILVPQSMISAQLAGEHPNPDGLATAQARTREIAFVRVWDTAAQAISLLLCCTLCVLGLSLRARAGREGIRREEAELQLAREQRALERRIQERTHELRQEVEVRRRAENLNRGQKQVLEMLAAPRQRKTEDILRHLTATVAAQRRSWECSLHLMNKSGKTLHLAASSEVDEKLRRYLDSISADFPDAPEGQACSSGQTCVVERMTEVRRPWSELLVANGILSAWSVPIRSKERMTGTLTVYCRLQSGPSQRDLELTEAAAGLAALVIEHRRIHDELVHNAYYDALTGVSNRRAGELSLHNAIETARLREEPVSIFWIDLDRFKRVNDQHGHNVGDEVLRAIAGRLRAHPLVNGNLARMGGDEFLVLIPGEQALNNASGICRQLGETIGAPISTSAGMLSIAGSIGVCCYPRDGGSSDTLERNADFAMYRAKSSAAGFCVFSPAMSEEVIQALELEEALRLAIERKLLRLVYQPIYARDGGLAGFEALLRFRNPELGEISPARFIPKAEETGLIVPIGEWVLREACGQLHTWLAAGFAPVPMSINISALQLAHEDFSETVRGILSECTVPPELLTIELTETAMMADYDAAAAQMSRLKEFGVRIALDDFGTGYSSLSCLQKLPIDVLKIDRSFTERLAEPEGTRPIVEAVIAMSHHLGVFVVAEGVETAEQRRILEEAGCNALQGYLLARPMPAEDAKRHLAGDCDFPRQRRRSKAFSKAVPA